MIYSIMLHGAFAPVHLKFLPLKLLLRNLFLLRLSGSSNLGEGLLLFDEDNFDVARRRHVRVDPSVSPVSPSPHFGSSVDLDMVNNQMISIEAFVFCIGLGVLQQM